LNQIVIHENLWDWRALDSLFEGAIFDIITIIADEKYMVEA
jgi:hypothetical protein